MSPPAAAPKTNPGTCARSSPPRDAPSGWVDWQLRAPRESTDHAQLQQVILNLMSNGADAMDTVAKEFRALAIRSSVDSSDNLVVAVADAGAGINPNTINQVFDPFFTTKPGSLGMGLAICRTIIEAHGGG